MTVIPKVHVELHEVGRTIAHVHCLIFIGSASFRSYPTRWELWRSHPGNPRSDWDWVITTGLKVIFIGGTQLCFLLNRNYIQDLTGLSRPSIQEYFTGSSGGTVENVQGRLSFVNPQNLDY